MKSEKADAARIDATRPLDLLIVDFLVELNRILMKLERKRLKMGEIRTAPDLDQEEIGRSISF